MKGVANCHWKFTPYRIGVAHTVFQPQPLSPCAGPCGCTEIPCLGSHLALHAAYDRKKYTWKLLYSHMMGFEVDFGHKQAADLIPSNKFDEKQVGYQALTIMLNEVCHIP